jgi:lysine-N-methylase
MVMPVRALPVVQNWDCAGCSACCRQYSVRVEADERARIEAQGWESEPDFEGLPLFVPEGSTEWRLNTRDDGACVFLGPDNRCRIHAKFGSAAKPLACRIYPFMLVPAGDHWRLGLRLSCPAAAESAGRPLADHLAEVREYAEALEAGNGSLAVNAAPTPLQAGQVVPWSDLLRISTAISKLLGDTSAPPERRWRVVLAVVATCRAAVFDGGGDPTKAVTGGRLSEFLHVIGSAMAEEVPQAAEDVPPPSWSGRSVFRPMVALYARKDHGPEKGVALRGPVSRVWAAMKFARGKGRIPKVHALIPDVTFAAGEQPAGPLTPESDALLTRYYRLKVESLQFCGPTNFDLPVWDGLESLALTFPAVMWVGRVLAAGGRPRDDALRQAVRVVDDNFGFNKLLGQSRQKSAVRLLAKNGELPKLVAWYGR